MEREREAREAAEVKNVLNLASQRPCHCEEGETGKSEGKEEEGESKTAGLGVEIEAACFCVSINVRAVKCVQGRRGGRGTGRAPYTRE